MARLVVRTGAIEIFDDSFNEIPEDVFNGAVAAAVKDALGNILFNTKGLRVKPDKLEFSIGTKGNRSTYQLDRDDYDTVRERVGDEDEDKDPEEDKIELNVGT